MSIRKKGWFEKKGIDAGGSRYSTSLRPCSQPRRSISATGSKSGLACAARMMFKTVSGAKVAALQQLFNAVGKKLTGVFCFHVNPVCAGAWFITLKVSALQTVFIYFTEQGGVAEFKQKGCFGFIAAGCFQCAGDQVFFEDFRCAFYG